MFKSKKTEQLEVELKNAYEQIIVLQARLARYEGKSAFNFDVLKKYLDVLSQAVDNHEPKITKIDIGELPEWAKVTDNEGKK